MAVAAVRAGFDAAVEAEWERMVRDVPARVSFELHRRLLERHVRPGHRVLEIGAGPGRFTLALAELGARVTVTDLSPLQLAANRRHVAEHGAGAAIEAWRVVDVRDVSMFTDGEFDVVVAYGGPLSYCFEAGADALRGLLQVTRPGGCVLASVMSLLGSFRYALAGIVAAEEEFGAEANNAVLETGDLRLLGRGGHICRMFRSRQIPELVEQAGGLLSDIAASNWASLGDPTALARIAADPRRWSNFLDHEERACREPGALDGGTHILFTARPIPTGVAAEPVQL
jgi:SAM-dependent methyltransferase